MFNTNPDLLKYCCCKIGHALFIELGWFQEFNTAGHHNKATQVVWKEFAQPFNETRSRKLSGTRRTSKPLESFQ